MCREAMHLQCLAAAICPQAPANVIIFTRFALGVYANTALQPYPHALFKDAIYTLKKIGV